MLISIALEMKAFILSVRRMGVMKAWLALLLLSLLSCFPSPQYTFAQEQNSEVEILRVSTDLVVFPIRVVDKNRKSISNLTERDFLFKDNDRIISSTYLAAGAERVAMVFAIDESGSLRDVVASQRDTALALFGHFKQDSRIAVLRFGRRPKVVAPFGATADEARRAFISPPVRNERTAIFDAAAEGIKIFGGETRDPAERRIVILISDGLDNASTLKANAVVERAREANISFYVIHIPLFEPLNGHLAVRPPAKGFRDLAEKTGGRYFLVGDKSTFNQATIDLSPVFNAIETDLKSQYLLGFYVAEKARDDHQHEVSITVVPAGLLYSLPDQQFSRTHRVAVKLAPR